MNPSIASILLAGLILTAESSAPASDLLPGISSIKMEFSADFESNASLDSNGAHVIPDHLNWSICEADDKLRCRVFQEKDSKDVLYRDFGFDGKQSFLFRPSDSGKVVIKKGYYPSFQNFADLRNPFELLFGGEYFSSQGREKFSSYVPLLGELRHSSALASVVMQIDPKSLNLTSPLISQGKNLVVTQGSVTTRDQFLGPDAKASVLVSVLDPLLKFPIAWIRKSSGADGARSISYEILQTQVLQDQNGKPLIFPLKSRITYKLGDFTLSQVTFTIKSVQINLPDIDNQVSFDPGDATIIEDVDAATIISIPK